MDMRMTGVREKDGVLFDELQMSKSEYALKFPEESMHFRFQREFSWELVVPCSSSLLCQHNINGQWRVRKRSSDPIEENSAFYMRFGTLTWYTQLVKYLIVDTFSFYMPTSFLCTFLICVLTLVVLSDVTNPLMSPVGTFVTSIQVHFSLCFLGNVCKHRTVSWKWQHFILRRVISWSLRWFSWSTQWFPFLSISVSSSLLCTLHYSSCCRYRGMYIKSGYANGSTLGGCQNKEFIISFSVLCHWLV